MVVKYYLARLVRNVPTFKDNCPGLEWVLSFCKRHSELTVCFASNIRRSRPPDLPPSKILNFDDSNLTDDPGKKRVLVKRGVKYTEKICNSSKSSTSLMFAGKVEGETLPPFVVYKSAFNTTYFTVVQRQRHIICMFSSKQYTYNI
ncbi:hypothetical protein PR048_018281 [Dryococelus australis]|uniref:Transposase n=1 Tax=Dryococelus australis TaxID=614101 RepID=A0ABQ9HBZ6_9NEOP|nr:hypothetical protein PR048_018281 [Dryococelus australis]